jgi:ParB family chromosome partitioning protein
MAKSVQKITLSASRDIPFEKLVLSQSNVRRVKAGVSIEELAADIARRTLLQSITVRPVLDEHGAETGMFEIPAGGRRYRALELLVKQKRLAKTAPIPCVVRTEGIAEEDSLAENVQRAPLHPLDQFRAFLALREKGQTEEEIAAAFFVAVSVVKQRLRLASVAPGLLEVYAEDGMTLDQLMAFSVSPDHARQEQVWEAIQRSYSKEPYQIRRLLTEGSVRASDKRAQYAGAEYVAAGGPVMRDLFQADDGGWFEDAGLLERVVGEKLERDAEAVRGEGWKWVEVATEFPYGHTYGMRLISNERRSLTDEEISSVEALRAESEEIEERYADADEIPEEIDQRLQEIKAAVAAIHERPAIYDPADIAWSGAFVSIDGSGRLRVQRGYVRPEDEAPVEEPGSSDGDRGDEDHDRAVNGTESSDAEVGRGSGGSLDGNGDTPIEAAEEDEGIRPLSDKLLTELTAFRTLALREAVGNDPGIAFLALLHVLTLRLFYRYCSDSCLEIEPKSVMFGNQAPGLADTLLAGRVDARHENWAQQLPEEPGQLWAVLQTFDSDSRDALFAHCVSLTINAVHEAWSRRPKAFAHASTLAEAVSLDMAAAGWAPTSDNYLGRVSKARILEAVREAKGEQAAQAIAGLRKAEMVAQAEQLLSGAGWLPEPLRTAKVPEVAPAVAIEAAEPGPEAETSAESDASFAAEAEDGLIRSTELEVATSFPEVPQPDAFAAE